MIRADWISIGAGLALIERTADRDCRPKLEAE